jgi:Ulp1 family protease
MEFIGKSTDGIPIPINFPYFWAMGVVCEAYGNGGPIIGVPIISTNLTGIYIMVISWDIMMM